jgi:NAD(P)-dependent dehydrogenase (short-subunit alcohol dehydrogenase family)
VTSSESKIAVVTGGASGIGFAMAVKFARLGWSVVIADIDTSALKRATAEAASQDLAVFPMQVDVADANSVRDLASRTLEELGVPLVVCNNAGVNAYGYRSWEAPPSTWEWIWSINVMGVVHGISSFVPLLLAAGRGHIVNTASVVGLASAPEAAPYAASKHAVVAISESLRYELAELESNVRVSVACPGLIATNIGSSARHWPQRLGDPAALGPDATEYTRRLEAARVEAPQPDIVADAVLEAIEDGRFLILPEASTELRARADRNSIFDNDAIEGYRP